MADSKNDFLIAQYQYLEREVNYSKQQQMRATNYSLILYGAIIHTHNEWYVLCGRTSSLLPIAISFLILLAGTYFIYSCKVSQKRNNNRAKALREYVCQNFSISEDIMGAKCEPSVKVGPIYYLLHFFAFIITALIIAN